MQGHEMVAYSKFVELSNSTNAEKRGVAAHMAALAYIDHHGPADENAALYASLIGFLDDDSVKVRAALAYGLLHAKSAPRPIMMSLLHDEPIIARAVAQYSPVLVDADLVSIIKIANLTMLEVIADRENLSLRLARGLIMSNEIAVILKVLARDDVVFSADILHDIALLHGENAKIRGALFSKKYLHGVTRLLLIEKVTQALTKVRIVKGSITSHRLNRLIRDVQFNALTLIGEYEATEGSSEYTKDMVEDEQVNPRLMLHALVNGHVMFFAQCLSLIATVPEEKVFTMLNSGSRAVLNALFAKSGIGVELRNLLARLVFYAREVNLVDDVTARHFIVTALIDELIIEHDGNIPLALEDAFAYLNEQNIMLARSAARGVMGAFAKNDGHEREMLLDSSDSILALPAA